MKPIKKFSMMSKADGSINESADTNHDAVMDLVKKMGYESIEELKKEKNLLSKLEGLLKDVSPKQDISEEDLEEDRADDIADDGNKKGEPKSLEGDEGEKEEDKETGATGEVAETDDVEEDASDDIEDEVLAKGEPKDVEDKAGDKVSDDPEITDEVPAEADEVEDEEGVDVAAEEEETPAATKRIMAFEDFIKEKEVTINKNVKYADDAEEPEDYSVVVASADAIGEDDEAEGMDDEDKGDELEDKGDKKVDSEDDKEKADHYKGAVKSDDSEIDALKKDVEYDEEEEKKAESRIMSFSKFVTESVGEVITKVTGDEVADEEAGDDGLAIPTEKGDGSETAAGIAGDVMDMGKVKVQPEAKGSALVGEAKITEKEITSADEFKEYAMAILKDAFGDDFDETKATETAEGLLKKYGEDYGAMVGALQSTMGS